MLNGVNAQLLNPNATHSREEIVETVNHNGYVENELISVAHQLEIEIGDLVHENEYLLQLIQDLQRRVSALEYELNEERAK